MGVGAGKTRKWEETPVERKTAEPGLASWGHLFPWEEQSQQELWEERKDQTGCQLARDAQSCFLSNSSSLGGGAATFCSGLPTARLAGGSEGPRVGGSEVKCQACFLPHRPSLSFPAYSPPCQPQEANRLASSQHSAHHQDETWPVEGEP